MANTSKGTEVTDIREHRAPLCYITFCCANSMGRLGWRVRERNLIRLPERKLLAARTGGWAKNCSAYCAVYPRDSYATSNQNQENKGGGGDVSWTCGCLKPCGCPVRRSSATPHQFGASFNTRVDVAGKFPAFQSRNRLYLTNCGKTKHVHLHDKHVHIALQSKTSR
jgi:hypothetical protein